MRKLSLLFLLVMATIMVSYSQDFAKDKWNGFNLNLSVGVLDGNLNKFYGVSSSKFSDEPDWTTSNLLDYFWGRGIEKRNGASIGLNLGYNWVIPARFLIGIEMGAIKTKLEFDLYGNKFAQEIDMERNNKVVKNTELKMQSSGNLVLGKIFGKKSDYLFYAKGGIINGLVRFSEKNNYNAANNNPSDLTVTPYVENLWNWGYNAGGGFKYAINSNFNMGIEYLYSKFNDMEQIAGGIDESRQQEFRTKQHFDMHSVNLNLTLNLSGKKREPNFGTQSY